jgi:hypothetical protein
MSEGSTRLRWTSDSIAGQGALLFGAAPEAPAPAAAAGRRGDRLPSAGGKTALLRRLLDEPEGVGTAVVVAQYGEIGITRCCGNPGTTVGNRCTCGFCPRRALRPPIALLC